MREKDEKPRSNYEISEIERNLRELKTNLHEISYRITKTLKEREFSHFKSWKLSFDNVQEELGFNESYSNELIEIPPKMAINVGRESLMGKNSKETILIMGGCRTAGFMDEMFILSGDHAKWEKLFIKLPFPTSHSASVLLNGEIYIFGGSGLFNQLFKLDIAQKSWTRLSIMKEMRSGISNSAVVFDGAIWVFGGWNWTALSSVEKYCPETNEWRFMPPMKEKRICSAAAVFNGKLVVCGGYNGNGQWIQSVECFDPKSLVWSPLADMPGPRGGHSLISDGKSLILIGGLDGKKPLSRVSKICLNKGDASWKNMQSLINPRFWITAAVLDENIFVIGGYNGMDGLKKSEIFNGICWKQGALLEDGACGLASLVIPKSLGDVLLMSNLE